MIDNPKKDILMSEDIRQKKTNNIFDLYKMFYQNSDKFLLGKRPF